MDLATRLNTSTASKNVSENSTETAIDFKECEIYTRYATTADGGGPKQQPKLRHIHDPIDDADFASPLYLLDDSQIERLESFDSGYEIQDGSCIAKELQSECEASERVLYPLCIESDSDVSLDKMFTHLSDYIGEHLPVNPSDCSWFFSGGRSIHAHIPLFIHGEGNREDAKRIAESDNDNNDVEIDTANFVRKSQFRLPGAIHHMTKTKKVELEYKKLHGAGTDEAREIISGAVANDDTEKPQTYADLLTDVFDSPITHRDGIPKEWIYTPFSDENNTNVETPLIEQHKYPSDSDAVERWKQYNSHPFSSTQTDDRDKHRSWCVATVKDTPYCRKDAGTTQSLLPCYVHYAVGADNEFIIDNEHRPVIPGKWAYNNKITDDSNSGLAINPSDHLLIICGKSSMAVVRSIDYLTAMQTAYCLRNSGREEAQSYLDPFNLDIGEKGYVEGNYTTNNHSRSTTLSESSKLRKKAETEGITTLTHDERFRVANHLLKKRQWSGAKQWMVERWGDQYSDETTHDHLSNIAKQYSDLPSPITLSQFKQL